MRKPFKIPDILSKEELKRLFFGIDKPNVMMATMLGYFGGLRISEVCKLRKCDFEMDRENPHIKVIMSKFGKSRNVPIIAHQLIPLFRKYFELVDSEYVMYSKKGGGAIGTKSFREQFNIYLDKLGLLIPNFTDKKGRTRFKYHFHTLRHTIATNLIEKQVSILYVQKFLGHQDVETVQIYTHISDTGLHETLNNIFEPKYGRKATVPVFAPQEKSLTFLDMEKLKFEMEKLKFENEKLKIMGMRNHPAQDSLDYGR